MASNDCARKKMVTTVQVELKVKEDEISQVKAEAMRVNKLREQTLKKIKQLDDSKAELESRKVGVGHPYRLATAYPYVVAMCTCTYICIAYMGVLSCNSTSGPGPLARKEGVMKIIMIKACADEQRRGSHAQVILRQ
eukprot:1157480-Pelagomonas_calceolata.AAC.8